MNDDSATATPAPDAGTQTPTDAPSYESTNDLDFEMTPEQEQDFVNKTLGLDEPAKERPVDDNKAGSSEPGTIGQDTETPEEPKAEPVATPPESPNPETPEPAKIEEPKPEPVETGTVDTSDLWIEVEGADGNAVKITLDGGVPDDFQFKSDKQLYEVLDSMQEMKGIRSEREAEIEAKTEQQSAQEAQQSQLDSWENETQTLIDAGILPEPKTKLPANGKQFTPEEIDADPSLKLQNEVYTFMKEENDRRMGENKPPIMSFGTMFNIYNEKQKVAEADKAKEEETKLTKERGALIGGTSAASGGDKPAYKAGSHANIWSVPVDA